MKLGRIALSLLLLSLGIGGFLAMGTSQVRKRPPAREVAPVVETVEAAPHREGIEFEVDGLVVPFRQVNVATEVGGRVAFKSDACRTGRSVRKGELLFQIDKRDYQLEVARLEEEVKQADATLDELELEIKNIENQEQLTQSQVEIDVRELERMEQLGESGAASTSEVDRSRRAELAARNTYQSLVDQKNLLARRRVRLESARDLVRAQLAKANLALTRTEIRSPLDAVVVTENVEQDGYVQTGSTVIVLQDSSQLDVSCKLHMRQMHWLWQSRSADQNLSTAESWRAYDFPETPARVIYEIGSASYEWSGLLNRYDGAGIDNRTRMIPCRVHITEPLQVGAANESASAAASPPTLMTGMFVKVRIRAQVPAALVRVPPQAIQPGNIVWTVVDGKLQENETEIAHSADDFVLLYEAPLGVTAGDLVVVSPIATPIDGLSVRPHPFGTEPPPLPAPGGQAGQGEGQLGKAKAGST